MYRKVVAGLVLLAVAFCSPAQTFTVIGDDNFPPFSFITDTGGMQGIDVDLVRELGKRLNVEFDLQLVPWKRLLLMTESGSVFGSFSLFKTPAREQFAIYTSPLHFSTYHVFTTRHGHFQYSGLDDLKGKKLGIEAGFSMTKEFDDAAKAGEFELVQLFNYDDTFRRLSNGGIDAFIGNDLVVRYQLKHHFNTLKGIRSTGSPIVETKPAFFVLSKAFELNEQDKWADKIKSELEKMENEGVMQDIIDRYVK